MSEMVPDKVKSFWEKKEGKTGMIFAAGGILGVLLIMAKWGATIVAAAQNTMVLGVYILIALAVGYVLMDKRFRTMLSFGYQSIMRGVTGMFVTIDPIGILKDYVDDLKASHEKMNEQIGKLRGVLAELTRKIKENTLNMKNSMGLAEQAKKQMQKGGTSIDEQNRMKAQVMLKSRKAGRLQDSTKTFQELHTKIEMIYRVLSKMYTNCGVLIEDTEDSIEQKETEWKTIRIAHSAMKSAMSVINGNSDKRALFEQALDYMATDLDTKVGEMQRFMEVSQNFLDGVDLQNGVFEEKGLEMLEQWEKDADSWLLGEDKKQIIADAANPSKILDYQVTIPASVPHTNQYSTLFK
jgi:hypothetical protein